MEHPVEKKPEDSINGAAINPDKLPKTPTRRRTLALCIVTVLATLLLSSGGMAAAYLLGRQSVGSSNLDQKRQTVVQEGEVIADIAQKVGPSVVSIVTKQQTSIRSMYYGGSQTQTSQAAGTGLIIDQNGLILTNKHVVPEGTSAVQVVTSDGTTYDEAQIIGRDPLNDLAVIKVQNPKNFTAASLADSDTVRTGEKVVAIGNALGQFQNTVTSGIISGKGRPIEAGDESGNNSEQLTNLFQTDAAINSGNSGGPLLDFNGDVVGINTAVAADAQNIGFAIPINEAKGIIASVRTTGKLSRPYIGVRYTQLTAESAKTLNLPLKSGAYVSRDDGSVVSGSPADKAGIKAGDVITKVNDKALTDTNSLTSVVGEYAVGDKVTLTVVRDTKTLTLTVTLAEAPSS